MGDVGSKVAIVLIGAIVAILVTAGMTWMQSESTRKYLEIADKEPTQGQECALELRKIDEMRRTDPQEALTRSRKLLTVAKTQEERRAVERLLSELLITLFATEKKKKAFSICEALALEYQLSLGQGEYRARLSSEWNRVRIEWLKLAARDGDWTTAARLLGSLATEVSSGATTPSDFRQARLDYAKSILERWERTRKPSDPSSGADLLEAAAAASIGLGDKNPLVETLTRSFSSSVLTERADKYFSRANLPAASAFFEAAVRSGGKSTKAPDSLEAARAKLARCRLALGQAALSGHLPGLETEVIERLLLDAEDTTQLEVKLEATRSRLDLEITQSRKLMAAKKYEMAEAALRRAMGRVNELWFTRTRSERSDPLVGLPPGMAKQIQEANPGADRKRKLEAIHALITRGEYLPPEADAARATFTDLYTRWGIDELPRHRERAIARLRKVLRDHPESRSAALAVDGVRSEIRRADSASDFGALLELGGFYVSEASPTDGKAPFRNELKKALDRACERFRETQPMQRVFLLSLIADLFPEEPDGLLARKEAQKAGFLAIDKLPKNGVPMSSTTTPSGLSGLSIYRIDNDTPFPLLGFFKGPETFFVRIDPLRRKAVALKDGAYSLAVVATKSELGPYREEVKLSGETRTSRFPIVTTSGSSKSVGTDPLCRGLEGRSAQTDYSLVRIPDGVDRKRLELAINR